MKSLQDFLTCWGFECDAEGEGALRDDVQNKHGTASCTDHKNPFTLCVHQNVFCNPLYNLQTTPFGVFSSPCPWPRGLENKRRDASPALKVAITFVIFGASERVMAVEGEKCDCCRLGAPDSRLWDGVFHTECWLSSQHLWKGGDGRRVKQRKKLNQTQWQPWSTSGRP